MRDTNLSDPEPQWAFVTDPDRAALMHQGVIVLADGIQRRKRWVTITGTDRMKATQLAQQRFGPRVDVTHVGDMPRRLEPAPCTGYFESEPCRLRVRYALTRTRHVDEILHAEDKSFVVVYATVCTPLFDRETDAIDGPFSVYLQAPLGDREVIDGVTGQPVRYRNVLAEIAAREGLPWGGDDEPPLRLLDAGEDLPYDGG